MKNYPYIYSLSTVGLIHHYNNDYLFNRIRTDFTGDSGTGKSMIADLLQLLFVGSSEFEAATESLDEKRRPKGMVLSDRKRGLSGKGYAFLNIALDQHSFLVMGMYLEHSTNYARPFIIFQGYDIDNPDFMQKPLSHTAFMDAQNILPMEELKTHLAKLQLNCESMQLSSYHRFLYRHQILPFDLADNPAKLKAYALIIQSFSRGKGFKFDTKNLQDFLFGTTWEKEILNNYNQQVENISASVKDSLDYQKQIAELTKKKIAIQELISSDHRQQNARVEYLNAKYYFLEQRTESVIQEISESFTKWAVAAFESVFLQYTDRQQQWNSVVKEIGLAQRYKLEKEGSSDLVNEVETAWKYFIEQKNKKDNLDVIERLLMRLKSTEKVKAYYTEQSENLAQKKMLDAFKNTLAQKNLLTHFEDTEWSGDYSRALSNHREEMHILDTEISEMEALLKFTNISDSLSIAFWAIKREKAFTLEEESLLVKLRELIISDPEDITHYYLPEPSLLFDNLNTEEIIKDAKGYWISLRGIYQYVPFVQEQFLNNPDPEAKKIYFAQKFENASNTLKKALDKKNVLTMYYEKLHSISALEENIKLYGKRSEIDTFEVLEELKMDPEDLDTMLTYHNDRDIINQEFKLAEEKHKKVNEDLGVFKQTYASLSSIGDINGHISALQNKEASLVKEKQWLQRKAKRLSSLLEHNNSQQRELQLQQRIKQSSLATVLSFSMTSESALKSQSKNLRLQLRAVKTEINQVVVMASDQGLTLGNAEQMKHYNEEQISQLQQDADYLHMEHQLGTDNLVKNFLVDDQYKYTNETDWKKIAQGLLPEVFKSSDISEEDFSSEIEERLQNIVEKNRVIGDRKVQILLEVFGKVETAFTAFSTEIDRLKNFFGDNDKRITGGHRVVIKSDPSTDYPIQWITQFKKQMREESINRTGLFKIADDAIDFKEIILRSFRLCGGKKSDPKVEDLLNPKKYFELNFSLQKDNIKSSGSTGQVYSAIALLCIARISLIEQEEGTKKRKGVRFMPVDEAEGLGSNYEMLSNIAKNEDYQIVSMSINPVGEFEQGSHYIYMLNEPEDEEVRINGIPFAQFTQEGIMDKIQEFISVGYDG